VKSSTEKLDMPAKKKNASLGAEDSSGDISALLSKLEDSMDNVEELKAGCVVLESVARSGPMWQASDTPRMVRILVHVIKRHPGEPQVLELVYASLSQFCVPTSSTEGAHPGNQQYVRHRECFYKEGGIEGVVEGMTRNINNLPVQNSASSLMKVIEHAQDVPQETLQSAAKAIINCMKVHGAAYETLLSCCIQTLRNLCNRVENCSVQDAIIEVIVACLRDAKPQQQRVDLHTNAWIALMDCWRSGTPHVRSCFFENKTLTVAVAMIEEILKLEWKEQEAWWAERIIAVVCCLVALIYSDKRQRCVEPGLRVIVAAMKRLPKCPALLMNSFGAIFNASRNDPRNLDHMTKEVLTVVKDSMAQHEGDEAIVTRGLCVFDAIAQTCLEWMADESFLASLLQTMEVHMHNTLIQGHFFNVLLSMVQPDEKQITGELNQARVCGTMIKAGCVAYVVRAINTHSQRGQYQDVQCGMHMKGCTVMAAISECVDGDKMLLSRMMEEGSPQAVCRAMSLHPQKNEIQQNGCWTLMWLLLGQPENARVIGKQAMAAVVAAVRTYDVPEIHHAVNIVFHSTMYFAFHCRDSGVLREYQDALGDCGGIRALSKNIEIMLIDRNKNSCFACWTKMSLRLCSSIDIACINHSKNQTRCSKEGVIGKILRLLAALKCSDASQPASCDSCTEEHVDDVEYYGVSALCNVVCRHPDNTAALLGLIGAKNPEPCREVGCVLGKDEICVHRIAGMLQDLIAAEMVREVSSESLDVCMCVCVDANM
jgi:hypothetical protein